MNLKTVDDPTYRERIGRGFHQYVAIPGAYGGYARLQDSSAAEYPCFWLDVVTPSDANEGHRFALLGYDPEEYEGEVDRAFLHMTAEQLRQLRDQIDYALANHDHGDVSDWSAKQYEED